MSEKTSICEILNTKIHQVPGFGISNTAIMASAGTGKTYQLAMRYIRLLLQGAEPESIVATTFSRKAAAEILDKIVTQLLELITSTGKLEDAIKNQFIPEGTTPAQLTGNLKKILCTRKHLHIETNDSFLMQIIQGAPAEFGICGEINMLDDKDDEPRQLAMLRTLHSPLLAGPGEDCARSRQILYQILKDCSYGKESSSIASQTIGILKERYENFLTASDEDQWSIPGSDDLKNGTALTGEQLAGIRIEFMKELEACQDIAGNREISTKFTKLLEAAEAVPDGSSLRPDDAPVGFFMDNNVFSCEGGMPFRHRNKDHTASSALTDLVKQLILHMAVMEYRAVSTKTKAVHNLVRLFDTSYSQQTRAAGKLTFRDILYLINRKQQENPGSLQVIQERLGTRINHYLLDEFQDTSTVQWNAFSGLIDEVITAREPDRFNSFFMVGDIKQSIYQWRSGNPDLFKKICKNYSFFPVEDTVLKGNGQKLKALTDSLSPESQVLLPARDVQAGEFGGVLRGLTKSFRSCTPVLNAVNRVFAAEQEIPLPDRLRDSRDMLQEQREKMDFQTHVSGLKEMPELGCAILFENPRLDSAAREQKGLPPLSQQDLTHLRIVSLLRKLDPFSKQRKKPLSVAILFRQNKSITVCYEALHVLAPDLKVTMEGKLALCDSLSYSVFRQMLILSAHPGDTRARSFFEMLYSDSCPKGGIAGYRDLFYPDHTTGSFSSLIREELACSGSLAFFRRFRKLLPETDGEREYMDLLEEALIKYAGEDIPTVNRLIDNLDRYEGRLRSADRTIQLMTIHQSKGLGFDIVILPDEELSSGRASYFIADEENHAFFFRPKSALLPLFDKAQGINCVMEKKACYEKCCTLYVAMTRAKRGLYMFVTEEKPDSNAAVLNMADLMRFGLSADTIPDEFQNFAGSIAGDEPLKVLYAEGNPDWENVPEAEKKHTALSPIETEVKKEKLFRQNLAASPFGQAVKTNPAAVCRPPSAHENKIFPAARFHLSDSTDFGTAVHEAMSRIDWITDPAETEEELRRMNLDEEVCPFIRSALKHPEICDALKQTPGSRSTLWREQSFLVPRPDGSYCSGILDRAVIENDEQGNPCRAVVMDYKTDRVTDMEELRKRYQAQLETYRYALSCLTGLPEDRISCMILSLRAGKTLLW